MNDEDGQVDGAPPLPEDLPGWNWGAFLLNWMWGLSNGVPRALLTLVPGLNFIMPFVLGARGNVWAWRTGRWNDVAAFRRSQRTWGWTGLGVWAALLLIGGSIGAIAAFIFFVLFHSTPYRLATQRLRGSAECAALLGRPIHMGFPIGRIEETNAGGWAYLRIRVHGSRDVGWLEVHAVRRSGRWHLTQVQLLLRDVATPINLTPPIEVWNSPWHRLRLLTASPHVLYA